ncbi:MAG TPA: ABC transporter substrate-binding protein [Candidatus Binatia bacterium]|jgi:ABC-type nitrate/sulfonate/bicarbonate transport system substrate-binding protein
MDKIKFPYRSDGHLALMHVIHDTGAWAKHNLEVEYDYFIEAKDAHKLVGNGEVEFVSGNHLTPYAARLKGDPWVYLGQTLNMNYHRLCVQPNSGINSIADLKGKVVAHKGQHPGLNNWLFLKENGLDVDKGQVTMQKSAKKGQSAWEGVKVGEFDGALISPPEDLFAKRAGLKIIEIPYQPMVWFTTISTSSKFADKHPDIVANVLKGICEGIANFKKDKAKTKKILAERFKKNGWDDEVCEHMYKELGAILEKKPYPTLPAIRNVFELAKRQHPEVEGTNPLALWDLHYLRQVDDSGFIDKLYA